MVYIIHVKERTVNAIMRIKPDERIRVMSTKNESGDTEVRLTINDSVDLKKVIDVFFNAGIFIGNDSVLSSLCG